MMKGLKSLKIRSLRIFVYKNVIDVNTFYVAADYW